MNDEIDLSLVLPCYRDREHLDANLRTIIRCLDRLDLSFEIILVDDGCPDGTKSAIKAAIARGTGCEIRGVFHQSNRGRGAAFMTGFRASRGRVVGFIDVDLEVSPVYIAECFSKIVDGRADMAIGARMGRFAFDFLPRYLLSSGYSFLVSRLLSIPRGLDSECGYKFFRSEVLAEYDGSFAHEGWFWDTEVVSRFVDDGRKIESVPCLYVRNPKKRSTVNPLRDSIYYLKRLMRFWFARRFLVNSFAEKDNTLSRSRPGTGRLS